MENLSELTQRIQQSSGARQRHWTRLARCADHEILYRAGRVAALTSELSELYAEKRQRIAGKA